MRKPGLMVALAMIGGLAAGGEALAQRTPSPPRGPSIADVGSTVYVFETLLVRSADARRTYKVTIARPQDGAEGPRPIVYMLDGGLALRALDDAFLQQLTAGKTPVLVAIGYEGQDDHDAAGRAYDYTPAPSGVEPGAVADHAGRAGGGADLFLDLIEREIRPAVEARIAGESEWLWGHSYGGLLTLHAALTRPYMFDGYFAASPSLWWNYGSVLADEATFTAGQRPPGYRLELLMGEGELSPSADGRTNAHPMWSSVSRDEAGRLAARLSDQGARVGYSVVPGAGHGATLNVSLRRALLAAAGLSETDQ